MNTNSRSRLHTMTLIISIWLTAGATATHETMMNKGMMENGIWYGFGGIGLTLLCIAVIGVVLFAVLRRR